MNLRKIAGLLAGLGLTAGLIGTGVGAQFTDGVTAQQNINVGTFGCVITGATNGAEIAGDHKSVVYNAPQINQSAAGNSPFSFTVHNNGTIAAKFTVTASSVLGSSAAPFSAIPITPAAVVNPVAGGGDQVFGAGLQWTELTNAQLTQSYTINYSVSCSEADAVIFDNTPAVLPPNLPSMGPEAYSYNEIGGQVQFAGTARRLSSATVTMSSWACQSGAWNTPANPACVSAPGATFPVAITFKVYNAVGNAVGSVLATKTQTFNIPYRPSADAVNCLAAGTDSNGGNDLGKWYNAGDNTCYNGLANTITFTFAGETMPANAIFGISFNTDNHGYSPIGGVGSPTDSLNVALNTALLPSVGSFVPDADSAYVNYTYAPFYTDLGAGGVGTFRLDQGGWAGQEPSVQITAN